MLYILLTRYWLVATHRAWELKEKKALFLREINLLKIKLNSFKGNIFFSLPKRHNSSETKFEMIESFLSLKNDLDCFSWDAGKNLYNQILLKMKFYSWKFVLIKGKSQANFFTSLKVKIISLSRENILILNLLQNLFKNFYQSCLSYQSFDQLMADRYDLKLYYLIN